MDCGNEQPPVRHLPSLIVDSARISLWLLASVLPCLTVICVHSQVFQVQGGSSTLFQANGGSMQVRTPDTEAAVGLGFLDGEFMSGGLYRHKWGELTVTLGDDPIPVRLPTDLFDSSHYFFGRGASVAVQRRRTRIFTFAGVTSNGTSTPFFPGGNFGKATSAVFLDHEFSRKLHFSSRNIFSTRQTSISGLDWVPILALKLSAATGVGANSGYFASGISVETARLSIRAGYVDAGQDFQRLLVTTPLTSENTGGNFMVTVRPLRHLDLTTTHFNLIQPQIQANTVVHANLNQYSATFHVQNTSLTGSLYQSTTQGMATSGSSLALAHNLTSQLSAGASLYHAREDHGTSITSIVGMLREIVCPRLSLTQLVNHSNGSTNLSWGGDLTSNPVTVGVNYQTVYSPFFPKSPFRQVLLFSLHFQPTHLFQVTSATFVGIDGSVKHTTYGGLMAYRGEADTGSASHFKFPPYVVQGRVVDENGDPVRGAAILIDKDLVFSNQDGEFFIRRKNRHPVHLNVQLNDFADAGNFAVLSCPSTAVPSAPDPTTSIRVVLQRHANRIPRAARATRPM